MPKLTKSKSDSKTSEIAIGKSLKISQAQQYMILSVLGASIFLGAGISITVRLANQISFNTQVITAEDQSIVSYSDAIKNAGICTKPKGSVYSDEELRKCNPDNIELSQIPNTLRSNILQNLAANEALNSVPSTSDNNCINPDTNKNYTYEELNESYQNATSTDARKLAFQRIKTCSALRIIPDALPAFKNEEALLASLNRIFNISNWTPESLAPTGTAVASDLGVGLNAVEVSLSIEADANTTVTVLRNIEKSIREYNIDRVTIEWNGANSLDLKGRATSFYMNEPSISESVKAISPEGSNKK